MLTYLVFSGSAHEPDMFDTASMRYQIHQPTACPVCHPFGSVRYESIAELCEAIANEDQQRSKQVMPKQ